jgi:periplasmic divalent cation tolerance protein
MLAEFLRIKPQFFSELLLHLGRQAEVLAPGENEPSWLLISFNCSPRSLSHSATTSSIQGKLFSAVCGLDTDYKKLGAARRFFMTEKRIILSTAGSEDEARKIAHNLVERQLAACVNIVPGIESIYRWHGKVESNQEWLLLIKTTAARFDAVQKAIRELHSYDLPECIAVSIDEGSAEYLNWIGESVQQK